MLHERSVTDISSFWVVGEQGEEKETTLKHEAGHDQDHFVGASKRKSSPLKKIEASLARARFSIREASQIRNWTSTYHEDPDYVPHGPVYRNANAFHRYYHIYLLLKGIKSIQKSYTCKKLSL